MACVTRPTASSPLDDADALRCIARMAWLDRLEGRQAVWLTMDEVGDPMGTGPPNGSAMRSLPAREGDIVVDGRSSVFCAARVVAYVRALRARRVQAGDNAEEILLR